MRQWPLRKISPIWVSHASPLYDQARASNIKITAHPDWGPGFTPQPPRHTVSSQLPLVSTMDPKSQQPKLRDDILSKLNEAIEDLNHAKEVSNVAPAKTVFGSTSALLPTIRVSPS